MLSVGSCGVARLQMKVGHMYGLYCFIDSTCILVKIKSVSLYDCRNVYIDEIRHNLSKYSTFSEVAESTENLHEDKKL